MSSVDSTKEEPAPSHGGLIVLWIFLFTLWLVINSSVELPVVAVGLVISFSIAWYYARHDELWQHFRVTPRTAWHFVLYTRVFMAELVKANIAMVRIVYSPRIEIHPGIVRIRMRLKTPVGRLALANSIALTPGSLVMDLQGDALFVHWLDVKTIDEELATEMIAGPFEKHLGAAFG
jgi:multicomponent Na+:H+ antiporter subunit E